MAEAKPILSEDKPIPRVLPDPKPLPSNLDLYTALFNPMCSTENTLELIKAKFNQQRIEIGR